MFKRYAILPDHIQNPKRSLNLLMDIPQKIFKKEKPIEPVVSFGERNEDGFCDILHDGQKTGSRMYFFTSEQVEELQKATEKLRKEGKI